VARRNLGNNAALLEFKGDLASTPLADRATGAFGRFAGERDGLALLLGGDLAWRAGSRQISQAVVEGSGLEHEPATHHIKAHIQLAGNLAIIAAITGGLSARSREDVRESPKRSLTVEADYATIAHIIYKFVDINNA
jgi:hypothetical protein